MCVKYKSRIDYQIMHFIINNITITLYIYTM